MILFQLLAIIFGLFMIYVIRIHRKKDVFDSTEFLSWIAVWVAFIFLAIFPQSISAIAQVLRIGRVFDAIVIMAFMVLSTVVIANRITLKKLEKKLEQSVRQKAIDHATKK